MEKKHLIRQNPRTARMPNPDFKYTGVCVEKHLDRVDKDIIVVEGDKVDYDKEIQSYAKVAGLETILKLQKNMYGTLDNAIKKNQAKQVFADVSKFPDSVEGQKKYVEDLNNQLDAVAKKLGISRDEVLNLTEGTFRKLLEKDNIGGNDHGEDN